RLRRRARRGPRGGPGSRLRGGALRGGGLLVVRLLPRGLLRRGLGRCRLLLRRGLLRLGGLGRGLLRRLLGRLLLGRLLLGRLLLCRLRLGILRGAAHRRHRHRRRRHRRRRGPGLLRLVLLRRALLGLGRAGRRRGTGRLGGVRPGLLGLRVRRPGRLLLGRLLLGGLLLGGLCRSLVGGRLGRTRCPPRGAAGEAGDGGRGAGLHDLAVGLLARLPVPVGVGVLPVRALLLVHATGEVDGVAVAALEGVGGRGRLVLPAGRRCARRRLLLVAAGLRGDLARLLVGVDATAVAAVRRPGRATGPQRGTRTPAR